MALRLETLWYEDENGNNLESTQDWEIPDGAEYQFYRPTNSLRTTVLRLTPEGSKKVFESTSSYSSELVLALCRPSEEEKAKQVERYGKLADCFDFSYSVLLAAETCERCLNSLAHRHGLNWGYEEGSDDWHAAGTTCTLCAHLGRGKFWVQHSDGVWSCTGRGRELQEESVSEISDALSSLVGEENVVRLEGDVPSDEQKH